MEKRIFLINLRFVCIVHTEMIPKSKFWEGIMSQKILIVEDDSDINTLLEKIMKQQGYETVQAFSGTEAELRLFLSKEEGEIADFDLILLDLMLPGMMGEELLNKVRKVSDIPVIVLSAKSSLEDKVKVLNFGADDYLVKPFEPEEVIARVNGAIKRYQRYVKKEESQAKEDPKESLTYKKLILYPVEREVKAEGVSLSLTAHEYDILKLLMEHPNKVFSRETLYEIIWQGGYYGEDNTVNMHISNLRKKISAVIEEEYIKTVWGIGYKLD